MVFAVEITHHVRIVQVHPMVMRQKIVPVYVMVF